MQRNESKMHYYCKHDAISWSCPTLLKIKATMKAYKNLFVTTIIDKYIFVFTTINIIDKNIYLFLLYLILFQIQHSRCVTLQQLLLTHAIILQVFASNTCWEGWQVSSSRKHVWWRVRKWSHGIVWPWIWSPENYTPNIIYRCGYWRGAHF